MNLLIIAFTASAIGATGYNIDDGSHSVITNHDQQSGRALLWNIERGSTTVLQLPPQTEKENKSDQRRERLDR